MLDLWDDREIYRAYRAIVSQNPRLGSPNEFFDFTDRLYITHMLVALRTLDDTDLRSHSLYNLIEEILDNSSQITEEWFPSTWPRGLRTLGQARFRKDWGTGRYPDKLMLGKDCRLLTDSCRRIRKVVNKYIAHTTRRRRRMKLQGQELDDAFENLWRLVQRYHMLLRRVELYPVPIRNWTGVLEFPWKVLKGAT